MSSSSSSPSNHGRYPQQMSHGQGEGPGPGQGQGQGQGQEQGYDHDHNRTGSGSGGQQQQQPLQQYPTFPSSASSASRPSLPHPLSTSNNNNNNNNNLNIASASTPHNSSFSPSSSSAPPNRHRSNSGINFHPNLHSSANTHPTSINSNSYNSDNSHINNNNNNNPGADNNPGTDNNPAPNQTSVDFPHHSKLGQNKFVSGPGEPFSSSSSFPQLPPFPQQQQQQQQQQHQQSHYSTEPQQQQQQARSDDYYNIPSPMTLQSKGGQYPLPSYQQSPYQPQQQQQQQPQQPPQQQQQRYSSNMNHSYQQSPQQQQQQQPYSSGYPIQLQQQQHQHQQQQQQQYSYSRTLPSPSVSLSSDEYLVHRDYASGGSSTGQSRRGQSEQFEDTSPSPRSNSESSLRFKATLDAQTAAMQHQGDNPSTYLNKGQFYTISIQDTEEYDGDIHSVIRIAFHEDAHRKLAARYWSFWLSQQSNPKTARALDIERASSTGMLEVQSKTFDRTLFKWNGKEGAKLMIRFNCLSTDFSRIKGVKGIPLRIQIETYDVNYGGGNHGSRGPGAGGGVDGLGSMNGGLLSRGRVLERSFAKIKLFRDKGAERKNKDDQKHLEKMWDKMRGKHANTNPLSQVLAPVQLVSSFWECPEDEEEYSSNDRAGSGSGSGSGSRGGSSDREGGGGGGVEDDEEAMSSSSLDFLTHPQGDGGAGMEYDDNQQQQDGDSGGGGKSKRRKMNEGRLDSGASTGYRGSGGAGSGGGGELNINGAGSVVLSSSNSSVGGLAASIGHLTTTGNINNPSNMIDGGIPLSSSSSSSDPLDRDPSYIPQQRKKKPMAMLCLYIKIGNEAVYRAIYLERPTLNELLHKLCEKLEIQASTVSAVFRKTTKKNLLVRADDAMVAQMPEELDMEVEYEFNQQDGSVNLTLKY